METVFHFCHFTVSKVISKKAKKKILALNNEIKVIYVLKLPLCFLEWLPFNTIIDYFIV